MSETNCGLCGNRLERGHDEDCPKYGESASPTGSARWQWEWSRQKPWKLWITWWNNDQLTIKTGLHLWLGWWRLSGWKSEAAEQNGDLSHAAPPAASTAATGTTGRRCAPRNG